MGLVPSLHVGSSQTRDQTHVSCIGWRILHHWATREALPSFLILFFNWRKTALQCCVGFCCTTQAIIIHICIFTYMHIYKRLLLEPPSLLPSHAPRSSESAEASHQLSVLHMVECTCQCYFLHLPHSLLPLQGPQVHFLYLSLHSFPANRLINTIFLHPLSIYMH